MAGGVLTDQALHVTLCLTSTDLLMEVALWETDVPVEAQHGVYGPRNSTILRELGSSGLYIESNYRVFYHVPADSFFRAGNILFR